MSSSKPSITISNVSTKPDAPVPSIAQPTNTDTPLQRADSNRSSTSMSESDDIASRLRVLPSRPRLGSRKSSGTMIVPANHPNIELKEETFPPNDARAMSPKRSSAETDRMIGSSRMAIQSHANDLQSGLNALVEKVENIKLDHEKLEKNNSALQDYIGGLTRSMSRTALDTGRKR